MRSLLSPQKLSSALRARDFLPSGTLYFDGARAGTSRVSVELE